mgnify:CR=1 FL=1
MAIKETPKHAAERQGIAALAALRSMRSALHRCDRQALEELEALTRELSLTCGEVRGQTFNHANADVAATPADEL